MKGDFSRFTFDPQKRYSRVLMQQGRVQLDADWNEQLDISAYRTGTEITDFIGHSGAPEYPKKGDQSTSFSITVDGGNITIGKGRYYVKGMLFENNEDVTFSNQPDCPGEPLPVEDGRYLIYLDVWQQHITALEEPTLREVALGGADTTTRVKNAWQVKHYRLTDPESQTPDKYTRPDWQPTWETPISTGELTAWVKQAGAIAENQLYRVEIHQGNATETDQNKAVTFKWSQDNGAIAAQVESIADTVITIQNAGRDSQLAFPINGLVELSNANRSLRGDPGILATVRDVQGNRLTVDWKTPDQQPPANPKEFTVIRHWDCNDAIAINPDNEYPLKQGITVKFGSGTYKTGDYWLIPARALTGTIEWPSEFKSQPPHDSTRHYYCSLALVELKKNQFSFIADCRFIFKPITSGLLNKAGDTMTGTLTINKNLYVVDKVGIGETDPQQKLVVTNGKVTIGYNTLNQTATLAINGNVGIGTTTPQAKLEVQGSGGQNVDLIVNGRLKSGNNDGGLMVGSDRFVGGHSTNKIGFYANNDWRLTVQSDGNVGIGTANPNIFTNARLVINSQNPNGGNAKTTPESVFALSRTGVRGQSWDNLVDFQIGRYAEDEKNSRTQLDILLGHGGLDYASASNQNAVTPNQNAVTKPDPKQVLTVVSLRSNRNINIPGKIGSWTVTRTTTIATDDSIEIKIEEGSYNNLIPIYSPSPLRSVTVNLEGLEKPDEWVVTFRAFSLVAGNEPSISPTKSSNGWTLNFLAARQANYVLVTACLAIRI